MAWGSLAKMSGKAISKEIGKGALRWGAGKALDQIFGDDTLKAVEALDKKVEQMSAKIDDIKDGLGDVKAEVIKVLEKMEITNLRLSNIEKDMIKIHGSLTNLISTAELNQAYRKIRKQIMHIEKQHEFVLAWEGSSDEARKAFRDEAINIERGGKDSVVWKLAFETIGNFQWNTENDTASFPDERNTLKMFSDHIIDTYSYKSKDSHEVTGMMAVEDYVEMINFFVITIIKAICKASETYLRGAYLLNLSPKTLIGIQKECKSLCWNLMSAAIALNPSAFNFYEEMLKESANVTSGVFFNEALNAFLSYRTNAMISTKKTGIGKRDNDLVVISDYMPVIGLTEISKVDDELKGVTWIIEKVEGDNIHEYYLKTASDANSLYLDACSSENCIAKKDLEDESTHSFMTDKLRSQFTLQSDLNRYYGTDWLRWMFVVDKKGDGVKILNMHRYNFGFPHLFSYRKPYWENTYNEVESCVPMLEMDNIYCDKPENYSGPGHGDVSTNWSYISTRQMDEIEANA